MIREQSSFTIRLGGEGTGKDYRTGHFASIVKSGYVSTNSLQDYSRYLHISHSIVDINIIIIIKIESAMSL
jgi:hypothetical protein